MTSKRTIEDFLLKPSVSTASLDPVQKRQRLEESTDSTQPEIPGPSDVDSTDENQDLLPDYVLLKDSDEHTTVAECTQSAPDRENKMTRSSDVGSSTSEKRAATGPPDVSRYPKDGPQQPKLESYPRDEKTKRTFLASYFDEHKWLEYSIATDSVFCFVCRHFAPARYIPEAAFTSAGYKNWRRIKEKKKGFALHTSSSCHKEASLAWIDYQKLKQQDTSVSQMISEAYRKEVRENREYIKTVADVLLLTAKQNIAQRGHREHTDPGDEHRNRGNFIEILTLVGRNNPVTRRKLVDLPQNAKYTSPKIQNEIIHVLAEMVRKDIVDEIKEAGEFSIMVDETKDVSKTEQLSFVLRYYAQRSVKESFITFKAADGLDAKSLTTVIISCLEGLGLNYKEKLVGQGYDGASVMSGKHGGVATLIKREAHYAYYVHCHAHRLNLALVDSVKSIKEANDFFSLLERLYVFMSRSYVHVKFTDAQRKMCPKDTPRELQRLSDTRWACRYISCRNIRDRLPAIMNVLELISNENNAERAIEARGLLSQIDMHFVVMLVTFCSLLQKTKGLSDLLQNPSVDLAKATDVIECQKEDLATSRSEESNFDDIWKSAGDIADTCDIPIDQPRRRRTRLPAALQETIVTEHLPSEQRRPASADKEDMRVHVFYPIVDRLIAEMNRRFSPDSCGLMQGLQSLNPSSEDFLCVDKVQQFGKYFCSESDNDDLSHLQYEILQAQRLLKRKFPDGSQAPSDLLAFTAFLEPYKDVFEGLFRLCKIGVTIPVSSAACERSFSTLKLVKTYLRNTMTNDRLSDLAVLHIEAGPIDMDLFIDKFAEQHNNMRINLF